MHQHRDFPDPNTLPTIVAEKNANDERTKQ